MDEWYDDTPMDYKRKAIKDYQEAGYAVDDDASMKQELLEYLISD